MLKMPPDIIINDYEFLDLYQLNRDFRIERNQFRNLLIKSPTDSKTGEHNKH
jgi:Uma2 family endonuclease